MASVFDERATQDRLEQLGLAAPALREYYYERGERRPSPQASLLKERIIFLWRDIDDTLAERVIMQLLYMQSEDTARDITLYINSHDGRVNAGLAIYDTMQYIKADVATYCVGVTGGIGVLLLAGGTKGKRFCLPHSQVVFQQPTSTARGQAKEVSTRAHEAVRQQELFCEILAKHTGKSSEEIQQDSDRRRYMTAQQAVEYGLVDEIITPEESGDRVWAKEGTK